MSLYQGPHSILALQPSDAAISCVPSDLCMKERERALIEMILYERTRYTYRDSVVAKKEAGRNVVFSALSVKG